MSKASTQRPERPWAAGSWKAIQITNAIEASGITPVIESQPLFCVECRSTSKNQGSG